MKIKDCYGLLIIDRNECTIGILRGERIEVCYTAESIVPGKHDRGGQSSQRMARIIEQLADEWFKESCKVASEIFLKENVKGVIVGGPGGTAKSVIKNELLHYEIQKKVLDVLDCGDTSSSGLRELVNNAHDLLEELGLTRERDLINKFLQGIASESGLITYGKEQVKRALQIGAVNTLLISENIPIDILEEFSNTANKVGSKVELISDSTEESKQFVALGSFGAFLRYKSYE